MVIGENAAFADDESGAEEIRANFGCAAFQRIHRVAITVVERLAIRIDPAIAQRAAGSPVDERNGYMQEAHAWRISTDHFFRGLRLVLHAFEPGGRFFELLAKCGHVAGPGARDFLAQFIRLLLELVLLLENIGLPEIGARAAGIRHQLLLAVSATLELGDRGVSAACFLVGAPGKEKKDSGDQNGDGEKGEHANFQSTPQRKGIAGHLLGDRERLESGLRHIVAFIGDAGFLQQFVKRALFAQLNTNTREQFRRLPRGSKYLVRAEIEAPSSLCSPTLREENHACPGGGRIAFDLGQGIAALDVGKVGGEKQKVDAVILNKLESFSLRGRYGHVITGRAHQFL